MTRLRSWVLAASAALGGLCVVLAVVAVVLDLRLLVFRSGSMAPAIETGALAVTRTAAADRIEPGDVVSVRTPTGSRVSHRVVTAERTGDLVALTLRGDANDRADATVYRVRSAQRVVLDVPLLGYAVAALRHPVGLVAVGAYAAFLLRVLFTRGPARPAPRRRRTDLQVAATLAVVALATALVHERSTSTLAAWTDQVATAPTTLRTATVAAPVLSCTVLGAGSIRFEWTAPPGATSYTFRYGSNGSQSQQTTASSLSLNGLLGSGNASVVAHYGAGSGAWLSDPSNVRNYAVIVISLCT